MAPGLASSGTVLYPETTLERRIAAQNAGKADFVHKFNAFY
jgi:hypothetical protein